jgi:hypothetical protein
MSILFELQQIILFLLANPFLMALYVICALLVGVLGVGRRIGYWGFVACSIVLTPPIFLVLALLTRSRTESV